MDSFSILPLSSRDEQIERAQLGYSFEAPTLRLAAALAGELLTTAACTPRVHTSAASVPHRRWWTVTVTTPPIPLTLIVLRGWEEELLAIERRWPECRFLAGEPTGRRLAPAR